MPGPRGSTSRCATCPGTSLYEPTARLVRFIAERLNKVQFLTIRAYLTLVFGALVVLLMILAIWN